MTLTALTTALALALGTAAPPESGAGSGDAAPADREAAPPESGAGSGDAGKGGGAPEGGAAQAEGVAPAAEGEPPAAKGEAAAEGETAPPKSGAGSEDAAPAEGEAAPDGEAAPAGEAPADAGDGGDGASAAGSGAAAPADASEAGDAAPPPSARKPAGHPLVVAGVATVVVSLAAYAAMAAGLGISSGAEAEVRALYREEDIPRRRELIDRGQMGNRLAIGAGVSAAVLMVVGITLVVVGRRRNQRSVAFSGSGVRVRF